MHSQTVWALVAVALGGAIASATQFISGWVTSRRDAQARNHAAREDLYSEYCSLMFTLSDGVRQLNWLHPDVDNVPTVPIEELVDQAERLLARMNLVASAAVLAACRESNNSVATHLRFLAIVAHTDRAAAGETDPGSLDRIEEARRLIAELLPETTDETVEAYGRMVNAMRRDLGNSRRLRGSSLVAPELSQMPTDDWVELARDAGIFG